MPTTKGCKMTFRKNRSVLLIALLTALLIASCSGEQGGGGTGGGNVPSNTPAGQSITNTPRPPSSTPRPPTSTPIPPTSAPPTLSSQIGVTQQADGLTRYVFPQGFGAAKLFWQVYFTAPTGSRDTSTYFGGIDLAVQQAIAATTQTLDIAAFEFNNRVITDAVLDAVRRGVRVRVVTDDDNGIGADDTTLGELTAAGIRIVADNRSALMHNKFMILDGLTVITGSYNFTVNGTYRNNNNTLFMRSPRIAAVYQAEFNEMYQLGRFGPTGSLPTSDNILTIDGDSVEIYFSPDDDVLGRIITAIGSARRSIRFMSFSFTEDSLGDAIVNRINQNHSVTVRGIFETTGSETQFSEMKKLFCAGLQVRQDGNPFVLHHKVIVIDSQTVLTGSFNFSANATNSNDENLVVVQDADLAAQYLEEFDRRWAEARTPSGVTCS